MEPFTRKPSLPLTTLESRLHGSMQDIKTRELEFLHITFASTKHLLPYGSTPNTSRYYCRMVQTGLPSSGGRARRRRFARFTKQTGSSSARSAVVNWVNLLRFLIHDGVDMLRNSSAVNLMRSSGCIGERRSCSLFWTTWPG